MKINLFTAIVLSCLYTVASMGSDRFPWLADLNEARDLAATENKPLLIVFRCEP